MQMEINIKVNGRKEKSMDRGNLEELIKGY